MVRRSLEGVALVLGALALLALPSVADAFCGSMMPRRPALEPKVPGPEPRLLNQSSQVVMARDGERTVITMSNDYKGPLSDFALVVPVPTVLTRDQVRVSERKLIERLDAYTVPRLVEFHDEDPCDQPWSRATIASIPDEKKEAAKPATAALGVKVEAQYTIGEYDIVILSAEQSDGLETWLRQNGYSVPSQVAAALQPYIKQDMKFFVAKVNLKNQKATGFTYLRPLQVSYESKKFMLPIRLGMANADGPQDLVIYMITRKGRVESTNYKTVKVPSAVEIPVFVKKEFDVFYKALFDKAHEKEGRRALHTEFFSRAMKCFTCTTQPLTPQELRSAGASWITGPQESEPTVLTRLHVRYDSEHFPEDLVFQETGDRKYFQAHYILIHMHNEEGSVENDAVCKAARGYRSAVLSRHEQHARTLASLTGWELSSIYEKMGKLSPLELRKRWPKPLP